MSPLTRERYIEAGLVEAVKTHVLTDSYPIESHYYSPHPGPARPCLAPGGQPLRLVHLGNLPEWRPMDTFLEALRQSEPASGCRWQFENYGYLYPEARQRIAADPLLRSRIHVHAAVDHLQSHRVAADADILLVMIGSRHLDNQPSKFFVYLGHRKPVLVLGPPGNPIQSILEELQIGVFCDVNCSLAIAAGLSRLASDYERYCEAFQRNSLAIRRFRADAVAADLEAVFAATLANAAASSHPGGEPRPSST